MTVGGRGGAIGTFFRGQALFQLSEDRHSHPFAVVMASVSWRQSSAELLTPDDHFKGLPGVVFFPE